MSRSRMKAELHRRLYQAQLRWFALKDRGETKNSLKTKGLREHGDMNYYLRPLIFMGGTRVAYERELKRFIDYAHDVRGRATNQEITRKDFQAYINRLIAERKSACYVNKIKSAIAKFGSLYGKASSFSAMSRKLGRRIRELRRTRALASPSRPRVTAQVRERVLDRLRRLDLRSEARTGIPRAYHLVLRLQKEAALRVIEATDRFGAHCLVGMGQAFGRITVLGKGGRVRELSISPGLYRDLELYFQANPAGKLAEHKAYRAAYRRAVQFVGGRSTGTHAQRRTSAQEFKDARYWKELSSGRSSKDASNRAKEAAVEHLGHSRMRQDVAKAYLR